MAIRVCLADDHAIILDGLSRLISANGDITVVATARDGAEALQIVTDLQPTIAVLDLSMPVMSGFDAAKEIIRAHGSCTRVVLLTMHTDSSVLLAGLRIGVSGYVAKMDAQDELFAAIKATAQGRVYFSKYFAECLRDLERAPAERSGATMRDQRSPLSHVLAEIVGGYCHDLGNDLHVSETRLADAEVAEARASLRAAHARLGSLHQLVRQFYSGDGTTWKPLGAQSIRREIHEICRSVPSTAGLNITIGTKRFAKDGKVPWELLRHVVVPLVNNAAEALQTTSTVRPSVWISVGLSDVDRVLEVAVDDNGPGWTERSEVERKVRSGQRVSSKGDGRGFGLQTVWRLVSRLGGDVRLRDGTHGGARVEVLLEMRRVYGE